MKKIDFNNVEVGDTLYIEAKVLGNPKYSNYINVKIGREDFILAKHNVVIVEHIPRPRPLEIGERVLWSGVVWNGSMHLAAQAYILGISGMLAWIHVPSPLSSSPSFVSSTESYIVPLNSLMRDELNES